MSKVNDLTQKQLLAILLEIHGKSVNTETLQVTEVIEEIKGRILMLSE